MTPPSAPNPSATPPRRLAPARRALFAALAVTLVLGAGALTLTAFNARWLREWIELRRAFFIRTRYLTMATFPNVATPERRDHLRACYKHPERIDFTKISWDLYCRPTPFVGYAPEPGEQGEGHFNAQQLRNRQDVALPKPAGIYRIFVTGGSHAYGAGAPTQDETIPAYLERLLNERRPWPGKRVEVFNAAVPGWASTHERIMIENRIHAWQPDLVIALTGANDAHWAFQGANVQFMRTYEDELYFLAINGAMSWAGAKGYPLEPPVPAAGPVPAATVAERFVRNVRLAALALEPTGARLVVALQPSLSPASKQLTDGERRWLENRKNEPEGKVEYVDQCFGAMARALAAPGPTPPRGALDRNPANLATIHVRDVFAGRDDAIYFDLFHMGDKGNELIARRLADELVRLPELAPAPPGR